jgi:hypothetical protein
MVLRPRPSKKKPRTGTSKAACAPSIAAHARVTRIDPRKNRAGIVHSSNPVMA